MVHGIGQRLEKANLVDDVGDFRHITASLAETHLSPYQRSMQRVHLIPRRELVEDISERSQTVVNHLNEVKERMRMKRSLCICHLRLSSFFISQKLGGRLRRVSAASGEEERVEKRISFQLEREVELEPRRSSVLSVTILSGKSEDKIRKWFDDHPHRHFGISVRKNVKKICVSDGDDCLVVKGERLTEGLIRNHYAPHLYKFVGDSHVVKKLLHGMEPRYNIKKLLFKDYTKKEAFKASLGMMRGQCGFKLPHTYSRRHEDGFPRHEDERIAMETAALLIMGKEYFSKSPSRAINRWEQIWL